MTRRGSQWKTTLVVLAILGTAAAAAFAQGPDGPPPGGFGMGGPGGPPPGGGFGRMRSQSALDVSTSTLTSELSLTSAQAAKIDEIKDKFQQDRDSLMPQQGDPSGPPDRETMRANMGKLRTLREAAVEKVNAMLTDTQSAKLKTLLRTLSDLTAVGIPNSAYDKLKLSAAQKTKLAAIAKTKREKSQSIFENARNSQDFDQIRTAMESLNDQTSQSVRAILSDDQKSVVDSVASDNSSPGVGGPPPGGGPDDGGGPPPGGGGPDDGGGPPPGMGGGPDGGGPPPDGGQ